LALTLGGLLAQAKKGRTIRLKKSLSPVHFRRFSRGLMPTMVQKRVLKMAVGALSIREFCQRFKIGRTRVYQEIKLGRLRAKKSGRRTLIAEADAEAWLSALPEVDAPTRYPAGFDAAGRKQLLGGDLPQAL
jgi:excisionase family DNA binding protein